MKRGKRGKRGFPGPPGPQGLATDSAAFALSAKVAWLEGELEAVKTCAFRDIVELRARMDMAERALHDAITMHNPLHNSTNGTTEEAK